MTGIVEFLTAQLAIDQAAAEASLAVDPAPWTASASDHGHTNQRSGAGAGLAIAADGVALWDCEGSNTLCMTASTATHIARHDPARVLREVAAKRRILERHHPADKPHWRPRNTDPPILDCIGCGYDGDLDMPRNYIHECPELLDLAEIYADRPGYGSWLV